LDVKSGGRNWVVGRFVGVRAGGSGGQGMMGSIVMSPMQLTTFKSFCKFPPDNVSGKSKVHGVFRHLGSTVVSTAASQLQGTGFNSQLGSLSVWSLHILRVSVWVSFGCSGFLPQSKDVQVRWIRHTQLPLSVQRCVV